MKLNHLRDILAVAEFGSLRAAGRHLGVAQPAITRSIREIEHELGVSLFERYAKGVRLTDVGTAFVRRAAAIQAELGRAKEEIEQLKGRAFGTVSMALSTASSIALLPAALAAFQKHYPDALLKISESLFQPIENDLLDGRIDLYVGPLDAAVSSTQLTVEKLFDNKRMVIARKGHALARATTLSGLKDAKWVRPTLSTRSSEADFSNIFEAHGLPAPQVVVHARSALITLLSVASSDLLTILPQQWLEFPATAERVCALPLIEALEAAPVCIVRRRDLPLTPMAEFLSDTMRRVALHYSKRRTASLATLISA